MQRALELAAQGRGAVEPNPMVGCVVARGAEILGEGWHRRVGGAHAEVEALKLAGERARGRNALRDLGALLPPRQDSAVYASRAWQPVLPA